MKALLSSLLLSLALLAGCSTAPEDLRVHGSGFFTLTNGTSTVFWGHVQDSKTNDLRFILLLPESDQLANGGQTRGGASYDYFNLKTKRDGHHWKLEWNRNLHDGVGVLRLTDLTAKTLTMVDLGRSRLWKISDDKDLIPLDKFDSTITERVLHESESGYRRLQLSRKGT